jgi:hypothetical protein
MPLFNPPQLTWNDGAGLYEYTLKGGNVTAQLPSQMYALCYNNAGATVTKGQVVIIEGAQGNRVSIRLALANSDANSAGTIGLVAETIAAGAEGWVQTIGPMYKLNTTGLTQGALLYLSPTTAGTYTETKPQAPQHTVIIGYVERVHASVGSIFIKVDNGYELEELHNVRIATPSDGQLLAWDATQAVWKNIAAPVIPTVPAQFNPIAGTNVTLSGTYPNITFNAAGGGGGGTGYVATATINLGATPVAEASVVITDANALATSYITVFVQSDSTADNDAEAHRHAAASWQLTVLPAAESFTLYITSLTDLCWGTFKVRYSIA